MTLVPGKRVILFTESELLRQTETLLVNSEFIDLSSRKLDIRDLDEASQQRILRFPIAFLGKQVELRDLIDSDELELVDGDLIDRLLNQEQITVGSEANCVGSRLPGFVTFHENLSVERLIDFVDKCKASKDIMIIVGEPENYPEKIKLKLCELFKVRSITELYVSTADLVPITEETSSLIKRRVLLVHSRSDYEYPHIIDHLGNHNNLGCYIVNIESKATIYSDVLYAPTLKLNRKLLLKDHQDGDDAINECEFIDILLDGDHRVFVLSDQPGSGKSHFLNYIQNILNNKGHHVMKFALRECVSFIDKHKIEPDSTVEDALRFLYALLGQIDAFGRKLFSSKIKECSKSPVILLLDGFDEIGSTDSNDSLQNKEKVANLITCLARYKSVHAVVTTRLDSETYLRNISLPFYMFKSLKPRGGVNYMRSYCTKRVRLLENSDRISPFLFIPDGIITEAFTNTPLHIAMISDFFLEMMRNELFESSVPLNISIPSLERLYSEFINMKYKIYFREKKNSTVDNRTKKICNSAFQKLALFYMYGNQEFTKDCFSNDSMFQHDSDGSIALNTDEVREYCDIGMISYLSRSSIEFVHRTFAEYFVGELYISWLHDKKLSKTSIVAIVSKMSAKYHLNFSPMLLPEGIEYLCRFINLKICTEQFSGDDLEAHHSIMAKHLGVNKITQALSSYLAFGYYNIASHIMKCWIKVGSFHELLLPTLLTNGDNAMVPFRKQVLSRFFSEQGLPGSYEEYFHSCMRCFCVIHEHGVRENPRVRDAYSICLGLLGNGNVEVLEGLIQVMVENQLISSDNKVGKLMHLAVHSGNQRVVKRLEEMGGNIFSKTDGGTSTVAYAVRTRKYEMAEWLQERGVKIRNSIINQGSDVINEACVAAYLTKQLIGRLFDLGFVKNRMSMEEIGGTENSLRLAIGEPWGHEDTLELLQTLAKLGSDVRICSAGGVNALYSVAAAGNYSEIIEWMKGRGLVDNDQSNGRKSALHVELFLGFLFKPAPESSSRTPDSTDEKDFLCDGHLSAIPVGNGGTLGSVTLANIALRNAENRDQHPKFNDKYHDIELDGIHTINSNDIRLIYSKYKNSVLRLINIMATSKEASKIGVLTVCGEVKYGSNK